MFRLGSVKPYVFDSSEFSALSFLNLFVGLSVPKLCYKVCSLKKWGGCFFACL